MAVKINTTTVVDNSGNVTPSGSFSTSGNITTAGTLTAVTATVSGNATITGSAQALVHYNSNTISSNLTIPANTNAMLAGPITIASGVTVTVSSGSGLAIV
jgi:hypothetical protein